MQVALTEALDMVFDMAKKEIVSGGCNRTVVFCGFEPLGRGRACELDMVFDVAQKEIVSAAWPSVADALLAWLGSGGMAWLSRVERQVSVTQGHCSQAG